MKIWRSRLFPVIFFSVVLASLTNSSVFAEDDISISISDDSVEMDLTQGEYGEETQTITASTTNIAGYTIGLKTVGPSSALINVEDENCTIQTFDLPSGSDGAPVSELGYGYGYSIDGGANFLSMPEPDTYMTTLFKTTSNGTHAHELTFGAKVPIATAAGVYRNTFIIEIVANMDPCAAESICYFGNDDDGTGKMEDQTLVTSNSSVMLTPSNFSRPGYGFVGWNTAIDGTGTDYGPSQTIVVGDLSIEGLQLYAKWVQSAGDLQGWRGCEAMSVGDVTALTDTRDGNTYAVAKYADEKCWMMENLRLDLSDVNVTITSHNTNKPTSDFANSVNVHPASSNNFCNTNNASCVDRVLHNTNNINRELIPSYNTNDSSSSWYSYGVYYNYYTATAGNGGSSLTTKGAQTNGDICPAGWRLPTAYVETDDLGVLDVKYGGSGVSQSEEPEGPIASERWRAYPLNFIYSGEQKGTSSYNRGNSTGMNSASSWTASRPYNLWIRAAGVNMTNNATFKSRGQTVRCVAKDVMDIVGNVHYDSNGGIGMIADQTNVSFATALASNNQFVRANFKFIGWNTSADGFGVAVSEGGALDDVAARLQLVDGDTLTLYAIWQPVYSVIYDDNGADAGSMASIIQEDVPYSFNLVASNFSRVGYGFAGWSTDVDAGTKLLNNNAVTVYGPNQMITLNNTFISGADANNQITLYAVWLPADITDTMQSFSSTRCSAMNMGEYLALRDERDGNAYAVSKLADGHCWMTENLRLNPSTTAFTLANTNDPTSSFIDKAAVSHDSITLCNDSTSSVCIDSVLFNANNINRNLTASPDTSDNSSSWYSYGTMYGWYTATAGNGDFEMTGGNVVGDICPVGWRLPTGGANGEFAGLANTLGGGSVVAINNNLLSFPNNFIYSGDYNYNTSGGRGEFGRYWSATPSSKANAYRLGVSSSYQGVTPTDEWGKWDAFAVRCIVK